MNSNDLHPAASNGCSTRTPESITTTAPTERFKVALADARTRGSAVLKEIMSGNKRLYFHGAGFQDWIDSVLCVRPTPRLCKIPLD